MAKKDVTKPISLDPRGGRPREKCVTYIEGIDRILNGGLPIGNIVLLAEPWVQEKLLWLWNI